MSLTILGDLGLITPLFGNFRSFPSPVSPSIHPPQPRDLLRSYRCALPHWKPTNTPTDTPGRLPHSTPRNAITSTYLANNPTSAMVPFKIRRLAPPLTATMFSCRLLYPSISFDRDSSWSSRS
ncbi:hypothetical protein JAAARDRAFT_277799 [Jaapia argillacea MUCL 33604]|uniref:Uncharacterized protein n=1 Tax=Jaapia argillacea MUCL 33604 TaxID=933084 RepID=A0A067Q5I0_9AGAM|nr:hypothetical protein JAAARDRAFT_277799 [Jaapia argillacea MUCL 33604]